MKNLKRIAALIFAITALFTAACSKDEEKTPEKQTVDYSEVVNTDADEGVPVLIEEYYAKNGDTTNPGIKVTNLEEKKVQRVDVYIFAWDDRGEPLISLWGEPYGIENVIPSDASTGQSTPLGKDETYIYRTLDQMDFPGLKNQIQPRIVAVAKDIYYEDGTVWENPNYDKLKEKYASKAYTK